MNRETETELLLLRAQYCVLRDFVNSWEFDTVEDVIVSLEEVMDVLNRIQETIIEQELKKAMPALVDVQVTAPHKSIISQIHLFNEFEDL